MGKPPDIVKLLCENQGVPIPRHRMAMKETEYQGHFSFREEHDRDAKRNVMMARLSCPAGKEVLPPLRDARVLFQRDGIIIVTGLEVLDELTRRRTAQTWYIKAAGYQGRGMDPDPLFIAD